MANHDITLALAAVLGGGADAQERLFALVYDDLCVMAHRRMTGERPGGVLQTEALVHEAFLRLRADLGEALGKGGFENRRHFFGAASRAMMRILVEQARKSSSRRREDRMNLEDTPAAQPATADWHGLDAALSRLEGFDSRAAEVVRLKFVAGLGEKEIGELLGISERQVRRDWRAARAWLEAELVHD